MLDEGKNQKNLAAGAIDIAIRDAEIHGKTRVIKTNGKIEEVTPEEMCRRLKKRDSSLSFLKTAIYPLDL